MSILKEKIEFPADSSIILRQKDVAHFTFPYHYHREYELVYVIEGYGIRHVGDTVEKFSGGDMVLLAPNLPHCWESDKAFYRNDPKKRVKAVVLQLPDDFFKTVIGSYPEFKEVKDLLQKSNQGVFVFGTARDEMAKELKNLFEIKGIEKLLRFLILLKTIAESNEFRLLASKKYIHNNSISGESRISRVLDYINGSYTKPIRLEELSAITGLTSTGFCLWFKRNTGKTFTGYIHELRVDNACTLLKSPQYTEMKISEIAHLTGFDNLSNFNRVFKKLTGISPKEYRQVSL